MFEVMQTGEPERKLTGRAQALFAEQQNAVYVRTDAMFGILLLLQWLAGIVVAVTVSPRAWAGAQSNVHIHVWSAVFLGALIIALPVYLALRKPGETITRHSIAIAQMLYSALFIHLSGGRIETHFHIFGSLAFLSFYRDWRVLITASLVVMLDHILRGIYFPQSVYGVAGIEPWRWLEHTYWVVFEDLFLIIACLQNLKEMRAIANRQAELEETRDKVEGIVEVRTFELMASEKRLATQYAVTSCLAEATTLAGAAAKILEAIVKGLLSNNGTAAAVMWTIDSHTGKHVAISQLQFASNKDLRPRLLSNSELARLSYQGLADRVRNNLSLLQIPQMEQSVSLTDQETAQVRQLTSAFALPFMVDGELGGVIEIFAAEKITLEAAEVSMLESLGQQLCDFALKMQIEAENRRLANMVEWSGEAIIGINLDGKITSWNRGAMSYFGYEADQAKGQHIALIYPDDKMAEMEQFEAAARRGEKIEGHETQRQARDGKVLDVSVTHSPVFDDQHRVIGISAVIHDITERKLADRRVSEFYSIVSHELRTPLTSVRGVLGLIEGGIVEAGSSEAAGLMTVARDSTDRLIRLINDMLDLKKIESGKMVLQCKPIGVNKLVSDCLDSLKGMAETAHVKLNLDLKYEGQVFADVDKATQVLTNLVSNAIKFSPGGSEIIVSTGAAEGNMARFKVIDNGPGIEQSNQGRLFEKFQQLDSSDTRQQGGTGLGLAICKALVSEHKGKIGLESKLGQGSTFWFELPVSQPRSTPAPRADLNINQLQSNCLEMPTKNGDGHHRILLVEDDADLAQILTVHFKHSGYSTVIAGSLKQARDSLAAADFNVVVLDLTLPDGYGLDLLDEIKESDRTAQLPVIVITGQSIDDKEMANPAVSDWLAKPFHSSQLIEVIDRLTAEHDLHAVVLTNRDDRGLQDLSMQLKALGVQYVKERASLESVVLRKNTRADLVILDLTLADQEALSQLRLLGHKENKGKGDYFPLVLYSRKDPYSRKDACGEDPDHLCQETIKPNIDKEESQSDLMNAVSALINGICQ